MILVFKLLFFFTESTVVLNLLAILNIVSLGLTMYVLYSGGLYGTFKYSATALTTASARFG